MKVLAIIPARGGSKGIPKKNLKPLAGKPLIAWTIESAIQCPEVNEIIVSTDDEEISKISKKFGASVPFMRPEELARDESPTIDAVLYTIETLEKKGNKFEIIAVLQPTSPLRTSEDITNAVQLFIKNKPLSLVSITTFLPSPFLALKMSDGYVSPAFIEGKFRARRQDLPVLYAPNGALYISTPETLRKYRTFYTPKTLGYSMPRERSVDIDDDIDFKVAESIVREQIAKERKGDI